MYFQNKIHSSAKAVERLLSLLRAFATIPGIAKIKIYQSKNKKGTWY